MVSCGIFSTHPGETNKNASVNGKATADEKFMMLNKAADYRCNHWLKLYLLSFLIGDACSFR